MPISDYPVGKGDGVHDEIEPSPPGLGLGEEIVELGVVADVERFDKARLDRLRQGMNPFLQRIAEIVEPELGPLAVTGPGHAPCDGFLVSDAEDQPFPALQNAHEIPPGIDLAPILSITRRSTPLPQARHIHPSGESRGTSPYVARRFPETS